jgi:poly(3-hydroxybutyrate) depolymerase
MLLATSVVSSNLGRAEAADTPACGRSHNSGYHGALDGNHEIQSGGRTRNYGMYVPDGYNDHKNTPRKLIIDFHGNGGSPEGQYENSQYYKYPQGSGHLVAYPLGINRSWQGASYATPGVDDLQFTSDLVAHIRTNYCVDPKRIYASGKSNGGGFVDLLACSDNGNEFAAFAMAAAALYTDNAPSPCGGTRPRKIIHAHGFKDNTIRYGGGSRPGGQTPVIDQWLGWWSGRNNCTERQEPPESTGYRKVVYSSCEGVKNVIQHYAIYNLGHCWPDDRNDNTDGSRDDCKDQSLDFTSKVLDFFAVRSL